MMNNAGARLARRTGGFGVITTSFNVPRLWSGAFIQTASRSVGARQGRKVSDKSEASSVLKTYYCKLVIERKLILVNLWINLNRIVKVCNNMLFPCVVSDFFFGLWVFLFVAKSSFQPFWDGQSWTKMEFFLFFLWNWGGVGLKKKKNNNKYVWQELALNTTGSPEHVALLAACRCPCLPSLQSEKHRPGALC